MFREVETGQELEADGAQIRGALGLQPVQEVFASARGDAQDLSGRLAARYPPRRDLAATLQTLEDGVRLALAQMPHIAEVRQDPLMEVIPMAGTRHEQAQQDKFGREGAAVVLPGIDTHPVSISRKPAEPALLPSADGQQRDVVKRLG